MLVKSERHTSGDLKLWANLERMDRLNYRLRGVERKCSKALDDIGEFGKTPCYAAVSWGKDSVVVAHLCLLSDPRMPLMHLRPSNHNPDCDVVRDAFLKMFPDADYTEVSVDYGDLHKSGLSDVDLDRETDKRWYAAIDGFARQFNGRHITGIRGEESTGRLIRMRRWGVSSPNGCAPLAWWKEEDVFAYLARHDLPVHPVYGMLGGGFWKRDELRVAEIGDTHGKGSGRGEWERWYYPEIVSEVKN